MSSVYQLDQSNPSPGFLNFQQTKLSLDSEDGFCTGCWNVTPQPQCFPRLQPPRWSLSIKIPVCFCWVQSIFVLILILSWLSLIYIWVYHLWHFVIPCFCYLSFCFVFSVDCFILFSGSNMAWRFMLQRDLNSRTGKTGHVLFLSKTHK